MKNFYFAIDTEKNGKRCAYMLRVTGSDNLVKTLSRIQGIKTATICETKKSASFTVNHWNACHSANGIYLYDDPKF